MKGPKWTLRWFALPHENIGTCKSIMSSYSLSIIRLSLHSLDWVWVSKNLKSIFTNDSESLKLSRCWSIEHLNTTIWLFEGKTIKPLLSVGNQNVIYSLCLGQKQIEFCTPSRNSTMCFCFLYKLVGLFNEFSFVSISWISYKLVKNNMYLRLDCIDLLKAVTNM